MNNISEIFGSLVFNDSTMRDRLPKETYKALKKTIQDGKSLDISLANVVAHAMKDWAIEKGVTHYTHWFQPLTGITAEKHDSFITPTDDGNVIMSFSGKELVKGEPDASSFPSGGLRATFEARGYTAWDPTSYAFIKDGSLCIPTAFCSYGGEALDKKTPLFGSTATRVITTVGPEQEYFLIDKIVHDKRKDLIFTGRTLFGAKPPKGQELDDHYFGQIKPRVSAFMKELDEELWKLGILAKTKHNEVAPAQHELAPIYTTTNIATDHNQLTMEFMKKIAIKHGLVCLLHEKPFAGVNGSGKHNNWSISTNTGTNLLEPGKTPAENAQFLLFLAAVIKAVDEYPDLMRISAASAGNDHRLGANEAPPAIISMFLGSELTEILKSIKDGTTYSSHVKTEMRLGVDVLPNFPMDSTDRNRTSPFAFTGNKFEFRMLGSTFSIAEPNVVLNTIVAEVLDGFATQLEGASDFTTELNALMKETITKHDRIISNGNNYSDDWVIEAEKKGLLNLKTTPEALPYLIAKKNIDLFIKHKVYTESEMHSRYEIQLENYCKTINIEALTMIEIVKKEIIPAVSSYVRDLSQTANSVKALSASIDCEFEIALVSKLSTLTSCMYKKVNALDETLLNAKDISDSLELALFYSKTVFFSMQELRGIVDEIETLVGEKYWPFPTYGDLLFSV